jgi:16S rRNA (cytosine1402-N4)-methyltransferase
MRLSPETQPVTAAQLIAESSEGELREILRATLAEREARRIARAIIRSREREAIQTTRQLAEVILAATPPPARYKGRMPMPALLAFRIKTNAELDNLREGILAAASVLRPETGRLVILTFHSAEFRVCRTVMKELAKGCVCPPRLVTCHCGRKPSLRLLTPKPLAPDEASLQRSGPQCRSCRLHAAQAT